MDATTDTPAPLISPTPVKNMSSGMQIFIAAIPSLPIPCPTYAPSMAVTADILSIPRSVGMKIFLNSLNTFTVPRSIASLFMKIPPFFILRLTCTCSGTKTAGHGERFYPVILSGCNSPPMRITKLSFVKSAAKMVQIS